MNDTNIYNIWKSNESNWKLYTDLMKSKVFAKTYDEPTGIPEKMADNAILK